MKRLPWFTLGFSALTLAVHFAPALGNVLQFDRAAVAHGQVWRFFTAHLTHFGDDHLRWDLLAFVVLGSLAEGISRTAFLTTLGAAAPIITAGVWASQPQFATYRGLSGIDSALFGVVVASLFVAGWRDRHRFSIAIGGLALAGFAAKCAFELTTGGTVFVDTGGAFAPVPLAHLLGMLTGVAVIWRSQLVSARLSMADSWLVPIDCKEPSSFTSSTSAK